MDDPCLFVVILGRSGRGSLSGHKLQHHSLSCLISNKDRAAFALHCRFHHQRRARCGFSSDYADEAGAGAPSNAGFSRPLPAISCGNSRTKPRSRFSPRAKPIAVPAARRKKRRLNRQALRQINMGCRFGGRITAHAQRCPARPASESRLPRMFATLNPATPARSESRCCVSRSGAGPASGTTSGWTTHCSSIPRWRSRCQDAIWMRSCWPRACRTASQRPALLFRPAERPWPDRCCRDFRPRSSQPSPCRNEADT